MLLCFCAGVFLCVDGWYVDVRVCLCVLVCFCGGVFVWVCVDRGRMSPLCPPGACFVSLLTFSVPPFLGHVAH